MNWARLSEDTRKGAVEFLQLARNYIEPLGNEAQKICRKGWEYWESDKVLSVRTVEKYDLLSDFTLRHRNDDSTIVKVTNCTGFTTDYDRHMEEEYERLFGKSSFKGIGLNVFKLNGSQVRTAEFGPIDLSQGYNITYGLVRCENHGMPNLIEFHKLLDKTAKHKLIKVFSLANYDYVWELGKNHDQYFILDNEQNKNRRNQRPIGIELCTRMIENGYCCGHAREI